MQFTKPMIELVYQIRSFSPSELKPAIKLANPELFTELTLYYHGSANIVSQALIKELFTLADEGWPKQLQTPKAATKTQTVKVYRGQISHEEKIEPPRDPDLQRVKKRVYRGQVIA